MKSKNIANFLKLAFGLLILFLLFYKVGFSGIYSSLLTIKIAYLPMVLLFVFITLILGNLNLKILFDGIKHIVGFWKLFKYYMLSWAVGSFVPGKIGGAIIQNAGCYGQEIAEMVESVEVYDRTRFFKQCI